MMKKEEYFKKYNDKTHLIGNAINLRMTSSYLS